MLILPGHRSSSSEAGTRELEVVPVPSPKSRIPSSWLGRQFHVCATCASSRIWSGLLLAKLGEIGAISRDLASCPAGDEESVARLDILGMDSSDFARVPSPEPR